jgi:hypothetical protein
MVVGLIQNGWHGGLSPHATCSLFSRGSCNRPVNLLPTEVATPADRERAIQNQPLAEPRLEGRALPVATPPDIW